MLTKLKAWLRHHVEAGFTSLNYLCRQPLATLMTVFVISVALVLPALFWVLSDNMERLTVNWQHGGHISLYLKSPLPSADELTLLSRVRETEGVGQANLKSAAQGLFELQKQEGMQDIMRYLPENPLPALIDVIPALDVNTPVKLEALYLRLKSYPQIEQAKIDMQWANRLHAMINFISKLARGLMIILAVAVVLIVSNTMRLAVLNRNEEIKILKLIGAKDSFIIRPFIYTGVWYGLAGALFAVLLVNIFMLSLTMVTSQLAALYQMHYSLLGLSARQMSLIVLSAVILGWLGASLSVKRQLAVIEP